MAGTTNDQVNFSTRHAGGVIRYHAWPTLRKQTIAEHTWHVTRIFLEIFGIPRAEVLVYIQEHDQCEIGTGDMAYHVKKQYPELKRLMDEMELKVAKTMMLYSPHITELERLRFKFCDVLEMYEFGHVEFRFGNRYALPIVERTGADLHQRVASGDMALSQDEQLAIRAYLARHDLHPLEDYA